MSGLSPRLAGYRQRAERALGRLLSAGREDGEPRLDEAMRYSLLAGGKRLRPVLLYAASDALGGARALPEDVDRAACAIECIHTYSLIHDDLPAMDNDELRRGVPTCHRAFDEATAILAGDALQALAFELLSDARSIAPPVRLELIATLASASGRRGMVAGQAIDLIHVGRPIELATLERMHGLKTGALIEAALCMGALLAGAEEEPMNRLRRFGSRIGLAFQVQDDILDHCGSAETLGKTPGADAALDKPTYVSLMGAQAAREKALKLVGEALAAIEAFGPAGEALAELARYVVGRDR